jgi:hypothetical protein
VHSAEQPPAKSISDTSNSSSSADSHIPSAVASTTPFSAKIVRIVWPLDPDHRLSRTIPPQLKTAHIDAEVPTVFIAFDAWQKNFRAASAHEQESMLPFGLALAIERADAWLDFARRHPAAALQLVPDASDRTQLPDAFQALLEKPLSGVGFYGVAAVCHHGPEGAHTQACQIHREVAFEGRHYTAIVYGDRLTRLTEEEASLYGVALGDWVVLHEDEIVITSEPGYETSGPFTLHYRGQSLRVTDLSQVETLVEKLIRP